MWFGSPNYYFERHNACNTIAQYIMPYEVIEIEIISVSIERMDKKYTILLSKILRKRHKTSYNVVSRDIIYDRMINVEYYIPEFK